MKETILLVDYEPRTIARVSEALRPLGCQLVNVKDVDSAVAECAKVEPRAVLITAVLPRISVEDAITQLRARAGLRYTPFLVLMSGYVGLDPKADAQRIGAQGIVSRPFANEDLVAQVREVIEAPRGQAAGTADQRAEVLEAMRRSGGAGGEAGTITSEELFADLLEAEPEPSRTPQPPPIAPAPPPAPARAGSATPTGKPAAAASAADRVVESTLADVLGPAPKPAKPKEAPAGSSVDDLLSQTLSGLQVQIPRDKRAPTHRQAAPGPVTPAATPAARPEMAKPAPAKTVAMPITPVLPARPAKPAEPSGKGGTPFGHYELVQLIATGGMAEVFKARMSGVEGFEKTVAIKRILAHLTDNDEFVTMFIDEAKLAAGLQHPNIIHIYDLGKIERSYYIAMEYIDGKDLRSILRTLSDKKTRIPLGFALFIASRLAAALDYAHRKHDAQGKAMALVHRDVSPQNVLISFDGDIKLCDFGIAKAASKASHTRAGALKGKLQYMSPEQAWGKDIDHRSDIFSLGLVLYEMVTGRKAFSGDSELSILEQVRSPQLTPPRDIDPAIPPEVERVILKALRENRDDRYQTAAELGADIDAILPNLRPAPSVGDLGKFLSEVVGRGLPAQAPAAPPTAAPPPARPAPEPARPARVAVVQEERRPAPTPVEPPTLGVSGAAPASRSPRFALLAAGGVVVVGIIVAFLLLTRHKTTTSQEPASATPPPAAVEQARQIAAEEVAKQEEALRQRLASEGTAPAQGEAAARPGGAAVAPVPSTPRPTPAARAQAVPPVPAATAGAQQGRQAPTAAPVEPSPAAAAPTPLATEPPTPQPEPTQAPTPPPQQEATRAPAAAVAPTVHEGDLVDVASADTQPVRLSAPKPAYPPMAERSRVGGTVILRVLVDENGAVQDVQVLRGIRPDFGFDRAAVDAVRTWRYQPATKNGVKVKVWFTQPIQFKP
ncbi:MAG: TonB family protein [Acidobacteriota bacterium]